MGWILGGKKANGKKVEKKVVELIASAGNAEGGKEGLDGLDIGMDRPDLARLRSSYGWAGGLDRRAEPPPAHSLGRVGEDVMGRSGQLVRARSLDADGVAGGEELMARLVVSLALARFLVRCAINCIPFFRHF